MCLLQHNKNMNLPRDARGRFVSRQTISPASFAAMTAAASSPPHAPNRDIVRQLMYTQAATPSTAGSYMAGSASTRRLNTLFSSRTMDDPNTINTMVGAVEASNPKAVREWLSSLPVRRRKEFMATFGGVMAANPAEAIELFQGAETENYRRLSGVPQGVLKERGPL